MKKNSPQSKNSPLSEYDKLVAWFKNKKLVAYLLVTAAVLVGAGAAINAVETIKKALPGLGSTSTAKQSDAFWCRAGYTVYIAEANIAVKLEADENFINDRVKLWVDYPRDANIVFDESAFMANKGIQTALLFQLGTEKEVDLGTLGKYIFYLSDPKFNADRGNLSGINVRAIWKSKPKKN